MRKRFQTTNTLYLYLSFHLGLYQNPTLNSGELDWATEKRNGDIIQLLRPFIQGDRKALTWTSPNKRGKVYLYHRTKQKVPGTPSSLKGLWRREVAVKTGKAPGTE